MAATATYYIDTDNAAGGRDGSVGNPWNTRAEAMTAIGIKDMVTDTDQYDIYCSGATVDTSTLDLTNVTSNSTYFIRFIGDAVSPKWQSGVYTTQLTATGNNQYDWHTTAGYWEFFNLQIDIINSGGYTNTTGMRIDTDGIAVNCLTKGTISGASSTAVGFRNSLGASESFEWHNCIAIDFVNGTESCGGFNGAGDDESILVYNCGFYNCYTAITTGYRDTVLRNSWVQGATTIVSGQLSQITVISDYNLSDGTSSWPGSNNVDNSTLTFVNAASDDYHLASGDTDAIGAGIGPSSDANVYTTDGDGDIRTGLTTDIGPDLYVAGFKPYFALGANQ